jgi:hypothetical protein
MGQNSMIAYQHQQPNLMDTQSSMFDSKIMGNPVKMNNRPTVGRQPGPQNRRHERDTSTTSDHILIPDPRGGNQPRQEPEDDTFWGKLQTFFSFGCFDSKDGRK